MGKLNSPIKYEKLHHELPVRPCSGFQRTGFPVDVIGLSANNLVPFSRNVVLSTRMFSANPVPKKRMFSVPAIYVLGPLQVRKATRSCQGKG
jgi:hypothetical protein